jgi:hypothetical protein
MLHALSHRLRRPFDGQDFPELIAGPVPGGAAVVENILVDLKPRFESQFSRMNCPGASPIVAALRRLPPGDRHHRQGCRAPADEDWFRETGVLRRLVPHWLREPDLRSTVLGFEEAGPGHGGAGALYVRLRRRDRR